MEKIALKKKKKKKRKRKPKPTEESLYIFS